MASVQINQVSKKNYYQMNMINIINCMFMKGAQTEWHNQCLYLNVCYYFF